MEMKQLRCFVTIAEAGSFTRASEQLHTAQSALSRQIGNLEVELGIRLFVRKGRGVELTPEGVAAYERARGLLLHFGTFSRELSAGARSGAVHRTVSISAHGAIAACLLPGVAGLLRRSDEHIRLRLSEDFSEKIERDVSAGECDIGIVLRRSGFTVERAELETAKLAEDAMFAIGPSGQGDLIGEEWRAEHALGQPLVQAPGGSLERAAIESWARHYDRTLDTVAEAAAISMRIALARQTGAFCLLPGIALADLPGKGDWRIHRIEEDEFIRGLEWFVIFRRAETDYAIRQIVDLLKEQVRLLADRSRRLSAYAI